MCISKTDKGEEQKDKNDSQLISDTLANKEEEREGLFTASYLSSPSLGAKARCPQPIYESYFSHPDIADKKARALDEHFFTKLPSHREVPLTLGRIEV